LTMFRITPEPLDPLELMQAVGGGAAGAVALFAGIVRNENLGRRVQYLEYDAYPPMAERKMAELAEEVRAKWPVTGIAMAHRTGRLEIGEASVIIAVSSPHRADAIEACHYAIDQLKATIPIWKKEVFEGGEEWLEGTPIGESVASSE
ncbi:MAG: molybdenum cofactor biosynthesis protein MoaE, partial [Dehalococcoidia bacterium]